MKNPSLFAVLLACLLGIAGNAWAGSTFHRLLVFNQKGELMLVRFADSGRWVTPGWYQDDEASIRQGLVGLATSHGITITDPQLRGVFSLRIDSDDTISTRLVHSATLESGTTKLPPGIDRIVEAFHPLAGTPSGPAGPAPVPSPMPDQQGSPR